MMWNIYDARLLFGKVTAVVFIGIFAALGNNCATEAGERRIDLKKILDDWRGRQASLASVRYEVSGQGMVPKGKFTGDPSLPPVLRGKTVPTEDHVYELKMSWLIDFNNNRVHKEFKEEQFNSDVGTFAPLHRFYIYDGSMTKRYIPKEDNQVPGQDRNPRSPELGLGSNGNTIDYHPADYPIFLAQGIVGLTKFLTKVPGPEKVRLPLDKLEVEICGRRIFEGKECIVLRLFPNDALVDELWIDPTRQSAILRMDVYARDISPKTQLFTRIDMRYREGGDLPVAWSTNQFRGNDGSIERSEKLQVDRVEINPEMNAGDFDIPLRPGMVVRTFDVKAGLTKDYARRDHRVSSDGKTLEDIDAPGWRRWRFGMFALIFSFSALVLVGWLLRRKLARGFGRRAASS